MKLYAHYGFRNFVLCLGYRGNMIKEYFLNYEAMNNDCTICLGRENRIAYHDFHKEQDFFVTLSDTGLDTMTGGRVKRVQRYIDDDTFMVTYGDGVSDINVRDLVQFHCDHGRTATMATVRPTSRFGILNIDDNGSVNGFMEKPQLDGWVNAGFLVFNRKAFDYLDGDETVLEQEPLQRLATEGQLSAYRHGGFFFAMDTYREYRYLNDLWDMGSAPWKVWD